MSVYADMDITVHSADMDMILARRGMALYLR